MMADSSNLWRNLKSLYQHYGSPLSWIASSYLWISIVIAALCWRRLDTKHATAFSEDWTEIVLSVSPALAGFSIATFALIFAILDQKKLRALAQEIDGKSSSPLLIIGSSLFHAFLMQVSSIVFAIVYSSRPIPNFGASDQALRIVNSLFSAFGFVIFVYGIMLVVASILTIFRVLQLTAKA